MSPCHSITNKPTSEYSALKTNIQNRHCALSHQISGPYMESLQSLRGSIISRMAKDGPTNWCMKWWQYLSVLMAAEGKILLNSISTVCYSHYILDLLILDFCCCLPIAKMTCLLLHAKMMPNLRVGYHYLQPTSHRQCLCPFSVPSCVVMIEHIDKILLVPHSSIVSILAWHEKNNKLKCLSSHLLVVFTQSVEARC